MPLSMNREVFITCAITGSGGTQDRSPHVPRSPEQIANSAIAAAKAGAAVCIAMCVIHRRANLAAIWRYIVKSPTASATVQRMWC